MRIKIFIPSQIVHPPQDNWYPLMQAPKLRPSLCMLQVAKPMNKPAIDKPKINSALPATNVKPVTKSALAGPTIKPETKSAPPPTIVKSVPKSAFVAPNIKPETKSALVAPNIKPVTKNDLPATSFKPAIKSDILATNVKPAVKSAMPVSVTNGKIKSPPLVATIAKSVKLAKNPRGHSLAEPMIKTDTETPLGPAEAGTALAGSSRIASPVVSAASNARSGKHGSMPAEVAKGRKQAETAKSGPAAKKRPRPRRKKYVTSSSSSSDDSDAEMRSLLDSLTSKKAKG
jgi:hypothetical protein